MNHIEALQYLVTMGYLFVMFFIMAGHPRNFVTAVFWLPMLIGACLVGGDNGTDS